MQKILIIDDDPSVTKLLEAKLKAHGVSVLATSLAREAVPLAVSAQPSLIVCDIDLGDDADGGAVARQLSANPKTASIPIVFLSSMITPADAARQSGGRRLISKLLPIGEIIERLLAELK